MPIEAIGERRRQLLAMGHHSRLLVFPRAEAVLHAMPTSCGFQHERGLGYDWDGLARGKAEFVVCQWTTAGAGLLTWEGKDLAIGPGQAMVVRIPHRHRYRVHPAAGEWEFLFVCLTGQEVLRAVRLLHQKLGPVVAVAPDSPALAAAMALHVRSVRGEMVSPFEASALAYSLAMGLLADLASQTTGTRSSRAITTPAAAYCRERPQEPLPVARLARQCGLSRFHFARRFRAEQGMTPTAYRQHHRIRHAVRLLRETDRPLKQIAAECGFADANYFGKVFRQHTGVSPGVFRRSGA